jgi:hypothetical protein
MANTTSPGKVIPFRTRHIPLPAGDRGVKMTINAMTSDALGREGAQNGTVRAWALAAVANQPDRDDRAQASAIYEAVKRSIKFRGEYSETVQTPLVTLQLAAGDCDDHATLTVALLRSIGIPARFETIAIDASKEFVHVFPLAGIRRMGKVVEWMPLDTTVPRAYPGWKAPVTTREKLWDPLSGLGRLGVGPEATAQPLSQKANTILAVIDKSTQSAVQLVSAIKNRDNTATFSANRAGEGVQASFGVSPTMMAVGGIGLIALLMRAYSRGR